MNSDAGEGQRANPNTKLTVAPAEIRLERGGRRRRAAATVVVFGLLLAGTFVGSDDHFPFGPFRMYARYRAPDQPVEDTRVIGVNRDGRRFALHERNCGIRRAEIEGQEPLYVADPRRLGRIADAYNTLHPNASPVVQVIVTKTWHDVADARPTGRSHTETVVEWRDQ